MTWGRIEVLELVDRVANLTDQSDLTGVAAHLARLVNETDDPARRLAVLIQMTSALTAMVDLFESGWKLDRHQLADAVSPALQGGTGSQGQRSAPSVAA